MCVIVGCQVGTRYQNFLPPLKYIKSHLREKGSRLSQHSMAFFVRFTHPPTLLPGQQKKDKPVTRFFPKKRNPADYLVVKCGIHLPKLLQIAPPSFEQARAWFFLEYFRHYFTLLLLQWVREYERVTLLSCSKLISRVSGGSGFVLSHETIRVFFFGGGGMESCQSVSPPPHSPKDRFLGDEKLSGIFLGGFSLPHFLEMGKKNRGACLMGGVPQFMLTVVRITPNGAICSWDMGNSVLCAQKNPSQKNFSFAW